MITKLFVGNLDSKVTENDLKDAFAACGTVVGINVISEGTTGQPRGFAFISMSSPEQAEKAIKALDGAEFHGRKLTVTAARAREERSGEGADGRNGGRHSSGKGL